MDLIEDRTKIPLCSEGKEDLRGWETRSPRRPQSGGTGRRLETKIPGNKGGFNDSGNGKRKKKNLLAKREEGVPTEHLGNYGPGGAGRTRKIA